ncbi:MAG TPA: carboxypeptidase regulatory-like domain-containing protein [Longimicrobium sp.]|jgi:hypothetical protein
MPPLRRLLPALLFSLAAGAARAQTAQVLVARVVDASTGEPVPAARVSSPTVRRAVQADSVGRLRMEGLPAGAQRMRVQAIGYRDTETTVQVAPGATTEHVFSIIPQAVRVAGVVGRAAPLSAHSREIETRRARHQGSGRFLTRDILATRETSNLSEVLRREMPGLYIARGRGSESYAASNRAQRNGALMGPPQPCYAQIFVDAVRIYGQELGSTEGPPDLNMFYVQNIEAVEYYGNPSSTPVEFRTSTTACGTLVIWTRRG